MELQEIRKGLDELNFKKEDTIQKAKYIRREGSPGNYKYFYAEDQGKDNQKKENSMEEKIKTHDSKIIESLSNDKNITIREMRQKLFDVKGQDTLKVTIEDKNGDKKDFTVRELRNKLFEAKQQDHPANLKSISITGKKESDKKEDKNDKLNLSEKDILNNAFKKYYGLASLTELKGKSTKKDVIRAIADQTGLREKFIDENFEEIQVLAKKYI